MKIEKGRRKIIAAVLGVVIVLLAICLLILPKGSREEAYRSIRIVELEGTVTVERESTGNQEAVVNMNLMSGDRVSTEEGAYIVLRLDADKYVTLGECGAMEVIAEGSGSAGRTSIHLTSGSVLSEIRNPLGEDATFDIVTPNATMSAKGTVFEVRRKDGEGEIAVLVYDGKVAVDLAGMEPALYEAGEYTKFTDNEAPELLTEREIITIEQMGEQIFHRLQQIEEDGRRINLGMVQIADVKTLGITPVPEPTMVPEAVSTPEAAVIAEPTTTPEAVVTPVPTDTPTPATGVVPAWVPRVTATPIPVIPTPEPDDTDDWEWEDDTDSDDAPSEPVQTIAPVSPTEPTQEPPQSSELDPGVEPEQPPESEPSAEQTMEPQPAEEPAPEPGPTEEQPPEPGPAEEGASEPGPAEEGASEPEPAEEATSEPGQA